MKKIFLFIISLLMVISGCAINNPDTNYYEEPEEGETELLSFEEAVSLSNAVFYGKIEKIIVKEEHFEFETSVTEVLGGNVFEKKVFVFPSEEDALKYKEGKEYLFVTKKNDYVMYDYDRYMISGNIFIFPEENIFTQYGEEIVLENGEDIIEYITENSKEIPVAEEKVYSSSFEETAKESYHIGIVKIGKLYEESTNHNGNVYVCKVKKLFTENELNKDKDGTIMLVLLKGSVEIGKEYLIGFDPASEFSIIYTQTTLESIFEPTEENINLIKKYI